MAPFDKLYATFYWSATVNIALSGTIFELFYVVEFYLYPTVGTVLIHSAKPELTE